LTGGVGVGPRLWQTETWQEGSVLGSSFSGSFGTFSPDSKLLALADAPGVVRLVRTATGKEVARLTAPDQTRLWPQCFTADGSQLITMGIESEELHIFDLRAIREQLQALGLDWDAPPFPNAKKEPPPLQVTVDLGTLDPAVQALLVQADLLRRKGDPAGTLAAIQKAQAMAPDDAQLNNHLAWLLAAGPDPKLRDAKRAVELARKAVGLAPKEGGHWNTLGVAHYRAGDWKAAVAALNQSRGLRQGGDALDFFVLAMAHRKLGDHDVARRWYDQALVWLEKNRAALQRDRLHSDELRLFQSEAEVVLELKKK
jgi:tetratricopeptide (TPR) repeat protein